MVETDHRAFLRSLTQRPGVYRMLDREGTILYVGKARNLKRRVSSYFGRGALDAKTLALLQAMDHIEITVTATEQEALLLEYNLIKEHKPRFNVVLRDDKSYPYIHVTTEQTFPRFEFHRGSRKIPGRFFGPFPNAGAVRQTLQQLQKLFRVRPCPDSFFANRTRPCLQYQIQRCSAPCVGRVSAAEYKLDVDNAMRFIEGHNDVVLTDLEQRMEQSSAALVYEQAARYRDQIATIRGIQSGQIISAGQAANLDAVAVAETHGTFCVAVLMIRGGRVLGCRAFFPRAAAGTTNAEVVAAFIAQHYLAQAAPPEILVAGEAGDTVALQTALSERAGHAVTIRGRVRGTRRRWLDMALTNARQMAAGKAAAMATLEEQFAGLAKALRLPELPEHIECFDISHTAGGETVASCVVFGADGPLKQYYRRFNVRDVTPGDDYAALAQVIQRRYGRVLDGELAMPDLILIDGGRGQLARAVAVLQEIQLGDVAVISVSKGPGRRPGLEQIHQPGRRVPLRLPPDSGALHLIQQIRDEAHRFAITGHRLRRTRKHTGSALELILGLGPRRRRALLTQLGGLHGVTRASIDDLARVPGISRTLAGRIYDHFHEPATP